MSKSAGPSVEQAPMCKVGVESRFPPTPAPNDQGQLPFMPRPLHSAPGQYSTRVKWCLDEYYSLLLHVTTLMMVLS